MLKNTVLLRVGLQFLLIWHVFVVIAGKTTNILPNKMIINYGFFP